MLVILTSHPIQYQAPVWRALADVGSISFEVWFLTDHAVKATYDREFGQSFAWDRNLLEGYKYRFLPIRPGWRMDRFRGITVINSWSKLFKEHGVTRLWVQGWRFSEDWAAVFAARRAGIEIWMRAESNDLQPRFGAKAIARRFLLKQLFARVDKFFYIGTANRRFYKSFGVDDARLLPAPYCVDNQWFADKSASIRKNRVEIRKEWGIPEDAFCLLFCGKFVRKKRPMDLVNAVRRHMEKPLGRKLHLLFVGSGSLGVELRAACQVVFDAGSPDLQAFTAAKPVSDKKTVKNPSTMARPKVTPDQLPAATFAGFLNQSEIIKAYVAADCLVLPSDTGETWGLVVNEAMASGLPSIVSEACGCAEDINNIPHCSNYPLANVEILASNIRKLASEMVNGATLTEAVSSRFSIQQTVDSVLNGAQISGENGVVTF
jgi:glycosyltransferase involved in cell wall biosynthesis